MGSTFHPRRAPIFSFRFQGAWENILHQSQKKWDQRVHDLVSCDIPSALTFKDQFWLRKTQNSVPMAWERSELSILLPFTRVLSLKSRRFKRTARLGERSGNSSVLITEKKTKGENSDKIRKKIFQTVSNIQKASREPHADRVHFMIDAWTRISTARNDGYLHSRWVKKLVIPRKPTSHNPQSSEPPSPRILPQWSYRRAAEEEGRAKDLLSSPATSTRPSLAAAQTLYRLSPPLSLATGGTPLQNPVGK